MKSTRYLLIMAAVASLFGSVSCESYAGLDLFLVDNPNNCEKNKDICLNDQQMTMVCDSNTKRCKLPDNNCKDTAQCAMYSAAACVSGACVSCMADAECLAWSDARRENRHYCVLGKCQQCKDNAGCDPNSTTPTCDTTAFQCRGCQIATQAADCTSGICNGDTGKCVSPSDIAYVSNVMPSPKCSTVATMGGTQALPFCSIDIALQATPLKTKIKVEGSATAYAALTFNMAGANVEIIGAGRSASPATTINGVTVNNGTLTLTGVTVNGTGSNAVFCAANASVVVQDSVVQNPGTGNRAINADMACASLTVERSKISAYKNGIFLSDGGGGKSSTKYRILNNMITGTGVASSDYAVVLGDSTPGGYFAFNTLTQNGAGVQCFGNPRLTDSIIVKNTLEQLSAKCLVNSIRNITVGTDVDLDTGEPRLQDTAKNAMPSTGAIDSGASAADLANDAQMYNQKVVTTDFYGKPRIIGAKADKGFHELK